MKALILDNQVVQIAEETFPVVPQMQWIDCDDTVQAGYTYNKDANIFVAPIIIPPPVPEVDRVEVLIRQFQSMEGITLIPELIDLIKQ